MYKACLVVLAVMVVAVSGYCADEMQAPKEFGGIISGMTSLSAVVTAIDYDSRMITLKDDQGNEQTIKAGPEVRNFAQINKGDKVNIAYSETVKLLVKGEITVPEKQENIEVSRAPLGEKPAGVVTATTQASATVIAIDYEKRTVTLQGPQRTVIVAVPKDEAPNFDKVKVGDTVYIEYTERLAISVTP